VVTLFALFFGAGQGLNYIARGSLPLYILGSSNYGKTSGYLNLYIKVVTAVAPFAFALSLENLGNITSVIILILLCTISIVILNLIPKEKNV
jgi:hypothetical protein